MGKLRISIVEFLNTAPLVWGFTDGPLVGKYDLSFAVPSQCAEDLKAGRADVGIIPAIEYQRMQNVVVLPGMAVASKKILFVVNQSHEQHYGPMLGDVPKSNLVVQPENRGTAPAIAMACVIAGLDPKTCVHTTIGAVVQVNTPPTLLWRVSRCTL